MKALDWQPCGTNLLATGPFGVKVFIGSHPRCPTELVWAVDNRLRSTNNVMEDVKAEAHKWVSRIFEAWVPKLKWKKRPNGDFEARLPFGGELVRAINPGVTRLSGGGMEPILVKPRSANKIARAWLDAEVLKWKDASE